MRDLLNAVRPLGKTFGLSTSYVTTFVNEGPISPHSPLRAAYAHIEPTLIGFLAGSMRLLRIPEVVYGLGHVLGERTLVDHLLGVYASNLAAIFGDNQTVNTVHWLLRQAHRREFPAEKQPDWFVDALGEREPFTPGDFKLRTAVSTILAAAVARAHQKFGVLIDGTASAKYCEDLVATVGYVTQTRMGGALTLRELLSETPLNLEFMDEAQLRLAGVPELLEALMATELAPGVPLSTYAPMIKGAMSFADRQALCLDQSAGECAAFTHWATAYSDMAIMHQVTKPQDVPATSTQQLSQQHFFAVAERRDV